MPRSRLRRFQLGLACAAACLLALGAGRALAGPAAADGASFTPWVLSVVPTGKSSVTHMVRSGGTYRVCKAAVYSVDLYWKWANLTHGSTLTLLFWAPGQKEVKEPYTIGTSGTNAFLDLPKKDVYGLYRADLTADGKTLATSTLHIAACG